MTAGNGGENVDGRWVQLRSARPAGESELEREYGGRRRWHVHVRMEEARTTGSEELNIDGGRGCVLVSRKKIKIKKIKNKN
jgi:hypothetical protein